MTTRDEAPDVLNAVRELVPQLRENGLEAEDNRWIPQANVDLLDKAGCSRWPCRAGSAAWTCPSPTRWRC
jgi:hypothetical protein